MAKHHLLVLGAFIIVFDLITAVLSLEKSENHFTSPTVIDNKIPRWYLGEQKVISWITELEKYEITIWQESPDRKSADRIGVVFSTTSKSSTNFTWSVQTYNRDLDFSDIFFFWAGDGNKDSFTSSYFSISNEISPTRTSASSASTSATITTTTSHTTLATSSASETSTSTSTLPSATPSGIPEKDKTGLNTTAKIALALGLAIGFPAFALLCFLAYRYIQRFRARCTNAAYLTQEQLQPAQTWNPIGGASPRTPNKRHFGRRLTGLAELQG